MCLPSYFVWTKHGTEAGQAIDEILRRKEDERKANNGTFFWGIGNAVGPSIMELLRQVATPEVFFSPIKSAPRKQDVMPETVVAWTAASGLDGEPYQLPPASLITSRFHADRTRHYALVCYSETPLTDASTSFTDSGSIAFGELRNILTGRPLGASQVTAVVGRQTDSARGLEYEVSFRARLAPPYFIQLTKPEPIAAEGSDWAGRVAEFWSDCRRY